jgi:hypothetical protein
MLQRHTIDLQRRLIRHRTLRKAYALRIAFERSPEQPSAHFVLNGSEDWRADPMRLLGGRRQCAETGHSWASRSEITETPE